MEDNSSAPSSSVFPCHSVDCQMRNETDRLWEAVALLDQRGPHLFPWLGLLVLLMQSGFPMVQFGRLKSSLAAHLPLVFVFQTVTSAVLYWLVGYGLSFGRGSPFLGEDLMAGVGAQFSDEASSAAYLSHWFFHLTLAVTVASVVVSSMADRGSLLSYLLVTIFLSGFIHPVVVHWCWSPIGWLRENDGIYYQDYAGAGVIHVCAGTCSTVAVALAGPRARRIDATQRTSGWTVPVYILGAFLLIVGFVAVAGGTRAGQMGPEPDWESVNAVSVTVLAAFLGGAVSLGCQGLRRFCKSSRRPVPADDVLTPVSYFLAGSVAGMVAVSAGCDGYPLWAAAAVATVGSLLSFAVNWVVMFFKGEDTVHAVGAHLASGIWSLMAAPIFRYPNGMVQGNISSSRREIAWNLAAGGAIIAWCGAWSTIIFIALKCLRFYSIEYDLKGSDILRRGPTTSPLPSDPDTSYFHTYPHHVEDRRGISLSPPSSASGL